MQAGSGRRCARPNRHNHHTALGVAAQPARDHWIQGHLLDADIRVDSLPSSHELISDRLGGGDRDRKANALRLHTRLGLACHQRIDADHLALQIEQWPARVAGVDWRVSLHDIEQIWALAITGVAWLLHGAAERAN